MIKIYNKIPAILFLMQRHCCITKAQITDRLKLELESQNGVRSDDFKIKDS